MKNDRVRIKGGRVRTIVIAGSHSSVGKTTLGRVLRRLLPGAVLVKIGHGRPKPRHDVPLYPMGTTLAALRRGHPGAAYLIIESNAITRAITPDLCIYLAGRGPAKRSAAGARRAADLVRGGRIACRAARRLADRLGLSPRVFGALLDAAGARLCTCEFGVF
ncbi:MAG: hypothetical protein ABIF71_14855 [Planctomycetota bacterium]